MVPANPSLAFTLLSVAGMMISRLLVFVPLSLSLALVGACAPDDPISMAFIDVGPSGMAPFPDSFVAGQCLDSTPPLMSASGGVACTVVEARHTGGACACDAAAARLPIAPEHDHLLAKIEETPQAQARGWDCFCEIPQLDGAPAQECQLNTSRYMDVDGASVDGFCYVDHTTSPPIGNPQVLANCPETMQHFVRFVGKATEGSPLTPTTRVVACDTVAIAP